MKRSFPSDFSKCQGKVSAFISNFLGFGSTPLPLPSLSKIQLHKLPTLLSELQIGYTVSSTLVSILALLTAWFFKRGNK